jgi:hypothetical protein
VEWSPDHFYNNPDLTVDQLRPMPRRGNKEMTKQILQAFTMLILIMMLAFASAVVSVYAQF